MTDAATETRSVVDRTGAALSAGKDLARAHASRT